MTFLALMSKPEDIIDDKFIMISEYIGAVLICYFRFSMVHECCNVYILTYNNCMAAILISTTAILLQLYPSSHTL